MFPVGNKIEPIAIIVLIYAKFTTQTALRRKQTVCDNLVEALSVRRIRLEMGVWNCKVRTCIRISLKSGNTLETQPVSLLFL